MGFEYRLLFECDEKTDLVQRLARLPLAHAPSASDTSIEFRASDGTAGMPDAILRLESAGAYFCDNGGQGREVLGRIVVSLLGCCSRVTIEDYEL